MAPPPVTTPNSDPLAAPAAAAILAVAVSIIEAEGYEALQLRAVAKAAQVSNATIYKHFPSRDELLVAATARWMEDNLYRTPPEVPLAAPLDERVMAILRHLVEPWKQSPRMLEAFVHARLGPGRETLNEQALEQVEELMRSQFRDVDYDVVTDVMDVIDNVMYALLTRSVAGQFTIDEMFPIIHRAVLRLTAALE
jgi:AcrR family transcriptional regulator